MKTVAAYSYYLFFPSCNYREEVLFSQSSD